MKEIEIEIEKEGRNVYIHVCMCVRARAHAYPYLATDCSLCYQLECYQIEFLSDAYSGNFEICLWLLINQRKLK